MKYFENQGDRIFKQWLERHQTKFLIFLGLILLYMFGQISFERGKCEKVCVDREYASFRYSPSSRFSSSVCHCLNIDEAKMKKGIPSGTRVSFK